MLCLFLHPVVDAPPFLNDDDGRMRTGPTRQVEKALAGVASARKRNCLHIGGVVVGAGERGNENEKKGPCKNLEFHPGSCGQTIYVSQKTGARGKPGREIIAPRAHPEPRFCHRTNQPVYFRSRLVPHESLFSGPGKAAQAEAALRWQGSTRPERRARRRQTSQRWRHRVRRRWRETRALTVIVGRELLRTQVFDVAAGLAFWSMMSLVPLLITLAALLSVLRLPGLLPQLLTVMALLVPPDSLSMVERMVGGLLAPHRGMLSFGILSYIWSTTGGFTSLITALNVAYDEI